MQNPLPQNFFKKLLWPPDEANFSFHWCFAPRSTVQGTLTVTIHGLPLGMPRVPGDAQGCPNEPITIVCVHIKGLSSFFLKKIFHMYDFGENRQIGYFGIKILQMSPLCKFLVLGTFG